MAPNDAPRSFITAGRLTLHEWSGSAPANGGCGSVCGCWFDSPGLHVKVSSGKTLNPKTAPGVLLGIWHGSNLHRCLNPVDITACLTSTPMFLHNLPFPTYGSFSDGKPCVTSALIYLMTFSLKQLSYRDCVLTKRECQWSVIPERIPGQWRQHRLLNDN